MRRPVDRTRRLLVIVLLAIAAMSYGTFLILSHDAFCHDNR